MAIVDIDHVQVAAPLGCEAAARRFYGELVGLSEVQKPAPLAGRGGVWFAAGSRQLHIGVAADFAPALKAHPAFRVQSMAELEALAGRLTGAGVEVAWDRLLDDTPRFFTADPWGNRLEFLTHR